MTRSSTLWLLCGLALMGEGAYAASGSVAVTAAVLSKSQCKFNAASATLAFGTVDPTSGSPAVAATTITLKCGGSASLATFSITNDQGLHGSAPNALRMKVQAPGTYLLPYTMTLNPSSGTIAKNVTTTIDITGTISPSDASAAQVGSYTDTVVLTLVP